MLRSLKDIEEYAVSATDGEVGKVANFMRHVSTTTTNARRTGKPARQGLQ